MVTTLRGQHCHTHCADEGRRVQGPKHCAQSRCGAGRVPAPVGVREHPENRRVVRASARPLQPHRTGTWPPGRLASRLPWPPTFPAGPPSPLGVAKPIRADHGTSPRGRLRHRAPPLLRRRPPRTSTVGSSVIRAETGPEIRDSRNDRLSTCGPSDSLNSNPDAFLGSGDSLGSSLIEKTKRNETQTCRERELPSRSILQFREGPGALRTPVRNHGFTGTSLSPYLHQLPARAFRVHWPLWHQGQGPL